VIYDFLSRLLWLDGSPLPVEPYRRRIFEQAFSKLYSLILCARGKKNAKSLDLVLAGLYSLLFRDSPQGAGGFLLANDEDQAGDDLDLATKLVRVNPSLEDALVIRAKGLERRDGKGELVILPARDIRGAHGKTAAFIGYDEIHEYRDYALLEALSPDPTRHDVLVWIASYDSLWHTPGRPLWDLYRRGRAGEDPRMLFSWYSGDYCTDPDFAELPPEQRANPSMATWTNPRYLEEQRLRLPSTKYRRLHLNLGGQPEGAALSAEKVEQAVIEGRKALPRVADTRYFAFVDMSGGSSDDAVLAIAHADGKRVVVDLVINQGPPPPFDPRAAERRFIEALPAYGVSRVGGDNYAGRTFSSDFMSAGIDYVLSTRSASELYQALEPKLNAREVELLDVAKLTEQLVGLVWKGGKITHVSGEHDDWANAVAGVVLEVAASAAVPVFDALADLHIPNANPIAYGAGELPALDEDDEQPAPRRERPRYGYDPKRQWW
jgi:hypothetical protein